MNAEGNGLRRRRLNLRVLQPVRATRARLMVPGGSSEWRRRRLLGVGSGLGCGSVAGNGIGVGRAGVVGAGPVGPDGAGPAAAGGPGDVVVVGRRGVVDVVVGGVVVVGEGRLRRAALSWRCRCSATGSGRSWRVRARGCGGVTGSTGSRRSSPSPSRPGTAWPTAPTVRTGSPRRRSWLRRSAAPPCRSWPV